MKLNLLLFLLSLFFHLLSAFEEENYLCLNDFGNYTAGSAYKANLDKLLEDIATNTKIDYGFYNFSAGHGADQVNVIALCRGDLTVSECQSCLNNITQHIRELCPNQKEAILHYDDCMVRYTNRSIFGTMEYSQKQSVYHCNQVNASDPNPLWNVADALLATLQDRSSKVGSLRKFSAGEANLTGSTKVYGLVQCTPDLSEIDCLKCLGTTTDYLRKYCYGSQGARYFAASCTVMFQTNRFYRLFDATTPPQPLPLPPPPQSTSSKRNGTLKVIFAVISAAAFAQFIIIVWLLIGRKRRRERNVERQFEGNNDAGCSSESLQFDFGVVRVATRNFSDTNKLGRGGFGSVYKGTLLDGQHIAVKRLAFKNTGQGEMEFKNEVMLVARLQHRNLVKLLGFGLEDEEKLLIYEFVPNASLDYFLFDESGQNQLDWEQRRKIIRGIARGLLYLHEDSRLRIIHRDLKASNILLDATMDPKIADFGVARQFHVDETQDTHRIVGTFGYMAPEYALRGFFSTKSDVYSFGVLILEILSGKRCLTFNNGKAFEHLINMVWRYWIKDSPLKIVDPILLAVSLEPGIIRCMQIGLLCVQDDAANRPTMSEVDIMLRSQYFALPTPSKPTFSIDTNMKLPLSTSTPSSLTLDKTSHCNSKSIVFECLTELYPR